MLVCARSGPQVLAQRAAAAVCAILLLWGIVPPASADQGHDDQAKYSGRSVADVLRELQASGLRILFSSDLVPATLRVKSEPTDRRPRQLARQILAEHGLTLEDGPRHTLLVVRMRKEDPPARPRPPERKLKPAPDASDPNQPRQPLRLEEWVEVTDRLIEPASGSATYTMSPTAVRETAGGFENVFQTFQVLPGVAAIDDDAGKLAVRGAGPEHNLVLLDGVQIHNPYRYSELTSSFLNPDTAARVSLDASGLDAAHGGRLSSVTVIETRDGTRDRRLAATASMGLASGNLLLEGRLPGTETGSWWVTTRGTYYQPLVRMFRSGVLPSFGDLQFKVTARPSPRTTLSIFGLAGKETSSGGNDIDGRTGFSGTNRLAFMNLSWIPSSSLVATTTLSAYEHDGRDRDESVDTVVFERDIGVRDVALRQRAVVALTPRQVLDFGVEAHRVHSSWEMGGYKPSIFSRGLGPSIWGEQLDSLPTDKLRTRLARTQAAFWVQDRVPIGRTVFVEPGLRLDWNSFTREASWQPRLRLAGRFAGTAAWVGFAVQAQTPSHESLQGYDYFHLTQDDGSSLRNERSRQFVAGFERALGFGLDLRVEAYRRHFDRLLVQRLETDEERALRLSRYELPPDLPPDDVVLERRPTMFPESTGRGRATGVEVLLQRQGDRLGGWLGYAFSRSRREAYGYTYPFDFDRPHTLSAAATVRLSRRFRLSTTLVQASGFAITPVHLETFFFQSQRPDGTPDPVLRPFRRNGELVMTPNVMMRRLSLRNSERLKGYSRVDVRVTYATLGRWEFYGEVINLLNSRNYLQTFPPPAIPGDTSAPGEVRHDVYEAFERLPSFGVRVWF